jgi:hypothetical protein
MARPGNDAVDDAAVALTQAELEAKIFKLKRYMSLLEGKIRKRELDVLKIKTKHLDDKKMVEMGARLLDPERAKGVQS